MARHLRIEVEGGLNHVIARRERSREVFVYPGGAESFEAVLFVCVLSDDESLSSADREESGQRWAANA